MSREHALQFIEMAHDNDDFASSLDGMDASAVESLAGDQGLDFTADELQSVLDELGEDPSELSDDDLDSVAGGVSLLGNLPKVTTALNYNRRMTLSAFREKLFKTLPWVKHSPGFMPKSGL